MSTANSWIHLGSEDKRYALPQPLRERDPMNVRDCGWVDQMMPFLQGHARHDAWLIDPFCGFGSTLVAAHLANVKAIGVEHSPERSRLATERLALLGASSDTCAVVTGNVAEAATRAALAVMPDGAARRPFDLCLTNIPYFGCSGGPATHGDAGSGQLYRETYYEPYLQGLREVFVGVHELLEPDGWCIVMAQNLQLGETFVPLAWDVARLLAERFTLHEERILVYDRPGLGACLPGIKGNRAHEYALICQKRVQALAVETGSALLARLASAGFAFAVYGSFARCLEGEGGAAPPGDIDLLVPPDDAEVSRLMRWLEGEGFRMESWNAPVKPPVAAAVLAHRYYFRARQLHRSGEGIQIDVAVAADLISFNARLVGRRRCRHSGVEYLVLE